MYARYIKRFLDAVLSFFAILLLSPLLLVLTLLGAVLLKGNPFFTQIRPGRGERLFRMLKFRSMTNACDGDGRLLPDDLRLTRYGRFIRGKSLDELPELWNILIGEMSFVGPRPQLVRDMMFMTDKQRTRHTVRPGLTGLAQVSGRNALRWEVKLRLDVQYVQRVRFCEDFRILLRTARLLLCGGDGGNVTELAEDYGDYLLHTGKISTEEYEQGRHDAKTLLGV